MREPGSAGTNLNCAVAATEHRDDLITLKLLTLTIHMSTEGKSLLSFWSRVCQAIHNSSDSF